MGIVQPTGARMDVQLVAQRIQEIVKFGTFGLQNVNIELFGI